CGSGAFLVAAARYLAARLVEAYHREGVATGAAHDLHTQAIRKVVANCLYGADINAMAVEMCKLSLWLVSLDPKLPFSFVDDKVLHGNSLLGLIDNRQLQYQHIDPDAAHGQMMLSDLDVDGVLARAVRLRKALASEVDDADPQRSATTKRRQWREYQELTAQLADVADGVVAAGLRSGGKPGRAMTEAYENLHIAVGKAYPGRGGEVDRDMLDGILASGLTPAVKSDYKRWRPLNWIVSVPDVIEKGGFDAVVGNPPFFGGSKITGALGVNMRDWLVHTLAAGQRGSADVVAYFFLRALCILNVTGSLGLIATNSVAQGATREVGLDRMVAAGFTITRSIQSRSWPAAGANLEFAAVWGTCREVGPDVPRVADDLAVTRISTLLEAEGRVEGSPVRLIENLGLAFEGCKLHGGGFVLDSKEAYEWLELDPENAEVLFPYINGEDLNSRSDVSPSRWVIDFNDRTESAAKMFRAPFERVYNKVLPERLVNNRKIYRDYWWQFAEKRPTMRRAIQGMDQVLAVAVTSKTVMPMRLPTGQVFSNTVDVFATNLFEDQAVLSSTLHQMWAIKYGSGLRNDPRYTPSKVFETFPRPKGADRLAGIGKLLDAERREIMLRRDLGLTRLYNLVNDPGILDAVDPDVARLRKVHLELDEAVMAAYDWEEVPLEHGFHTYRQMRRWTVSPKARVEILDRLLEENHRRAAAQGEAPPPAEAENDTEDAVAEDG
ncbi:MAG: SAM-dependent DNA methyltransferase, partial [Acidobacteria bacterium]|nr:SAM-dependent DNA methyltransferase [Acidobacteriota bacterium]